MNRTDIKCENLIFSDHAVNQMFKRDISIVNVQTIINSGIIINDYPNDIPFPSCLMLGYLSHRPIHIVIGINQKDCVIITAYEPDPHLWDKDFKIKIK
jgi:hypothetical protein